MDQGEGKTAFVVEEGRRTPGGVQVHVLQGIFTDCPAAYDFLTELRAELAEPGGDVVLGVSGLLGPGRLYGEIDAGAAWLSEPLVKISLVRFLLNVGYRFQL